MMLLSCVSCFQGKEQKEFQEDLVLELAMRLEQKYQHESDEMSAEQNQSNEKNDLLGASGNGQTKTIEGENN